MKTSTFLRVLGFMMLFSIAAPLAGNAAENPLSGDSSLMQGKTDEREPDKTAFDDEMPGLENKGDVRYHQMETRKEMQDLEIKHEMEKKMQNQSPK